MKLLLDTHVLLWAAGAPDKLSRKARAFLLDDANALYFSSASLWEIVIKRGLGRPDFRVDPARLRRLLVSVGYGELAVTSDHVLALEHLPPLRRDPFDRVLVAQARSEGMQLLTADTQVAHYGDGVLAI